MGLYFKVREGLDLLNRARVEITIQKSEISNEEKKAQVGTAKAENLEEAKRHNELAATALEQAIAQQARAQALEQQAAQLSVGRETARAELLQSEANFLKKGAEDSRIEAKKEYQRAQECIEKAHQYELSLDRRL